jgi:hypothetical protein
MGIRECEKQRPAGASPQCTPRPPEYVSVRMLESHSHTHTKSAQLACARAPALEGTLIAMQIENYGEFQLRPRRAGEESIVYVSASFKTSGERNGIINPH